MKGQLRFVKITTLADNVAQTGGLLGQWGLSFFIEFTAVDGEAHCILFDTGAVKTALFHNVKLLKPDLSKIEYVILSHGHADHTSATVEIMKRIAGKAKVVAHPHLFLPKFIMSKDGKKKDSGLPKGERLQDIKKIGEVVATERSLELLPGVSTTGEIPRNCSFERDSPPIGGGKRFTVIKGKTVQDRLLDDQALLFNVRGNGYLVVTGCAHSGIVNTLNQVRRVADSQDIYGVIGGFHLTGQKDSYIARTVEELKTFNLRLISPCHCTGFRAACRLNETFPKQFIENFSGKVIELGAES